MTYLLPSDQLFRGIELKLLKEKANSYLNQKGKILDLGCGDGRIAKILFNRKVDYGLDISQKALDSAEEKNIYKSLISAKAENIPLKDNSIDLVFSNCTIEHIKNLETVLGEVKRVLKKNGGFIFTVPSDFYTEYNIFNKIEIVPICKLYGWLRNKKLNHYHVYSLDKWKNILKKYNFKIEDYYFYHDLKTIYFWDILFWLSPLFSLIKWQPKFLSQKIEKVINEARTLQGQGATLFIYAKLN